MLHFQPFFLNFPPPNLVGAASLLPDQDRSDSYSFNLLGSAYGFLNYENKKLQNAY